MTVSLIIAKAIDDNAKKRAVRKFFVEHEGKKQLVVKVGPSIYTVDYNDFLDQMSQLVQKNVNKPEFVSLMTGEFTTTTKVDRINNQISMMSAVQNYFEYTMCTLCGIPAVDMEGTREDWAALGTRSLPTALCKGQ